MTAMWFAVGVLFVAVVIVTVGLCVAAKRADRALGYEDDDECD